MADMDSQLPADSLYLELMGEGMNPPSNPMSSLIKTVGEKTPQIDMGDDPVRFEREMLLPPEERKQYTEAMRDLEYDFSPNKPVRAPDEPFSAFSQRLMRYAANKSLVQGS